MKNIQELGELILTMDKLKLVFRYTETAQNRKESTAEHSWSVSMIIMILMAELKKEFPSIDELKAIKLSLIHDVVEIYAGDVLVFNTQARKDHEAIEAEALKKLISIHPVFGQQLQELWHEFEKKESTEAKIAKAADAICPIFQRLHSKQSYLPSEITIAVLEKVKFPYFSFSKTFTALYQQLKADLLKENLILEGE